MSNDMTVKPETTLKSIALSVTTKTFDIDTSTAFTKTYYTVKVRVFDDNGVQTDAAVESFDTRDEAQAYMADVATRDLRSLNFGTLLSEHR